MNPIIEEKMILYYSKEVKSYLEMQ